MIIVPCCLQSIQLLRVLCLYIEINKSSISQDLSLLLSLCHITWFLDSAIIDLQGSRPFGKDASKTCENYLPERIYKFTCKLVRLSHMRSKAVVKRRMEEEIRPWLIMAAKVQVSSIWHEDTLASVLGYKLKCYLSRSSLDTRCDCRSWVGKQVIFVRYYQWQSVLGEIPLFIWAVAPAQTEISSWFDLVPESMGCRISKQYTWLGTVRDRLKLASFNLGYEALWWVIDNTSRQASLLHQCQITESVWSGWGLNTDDSKQKTCYRVPGERSFVTISNWVLYSLRKICSDVSSFKRPHEAVA